MSDLPSTVPSALRCDVLVVGAGPAGSACAAALARSGVDVLLVDQHRFPRDKVCGDGLIPDAMAALERLGALDEVSDLATHVPHVRCVAPRGAAVDVPGRIAVLPRRVLDDLLVKRAVAAGARTWMPAKFEAPIDDAGRVVGARLRSDAGAVDVAARWVVLATGAVPQALQAAGVCERHTPSGVALRGYVRHDGLAATIRQLQMVWHPRLAGGYGWIFPGPGNVFNIGAGLTGSHVVTRAGRGRMHDHVNLRAMFDAFCDVYAPARELMRDGELLGAVKGAPLRCTLRGARYSRPGLLVTGEAAGSTYAFTGEGIGKAMETGLLAADALRGARRADAVAGDADVRGRYEAALCALQPRFDLYDKASHVNHRPWIADVVVWRARRSPRILARLAGLLEETSNPGNLFTWRGVRRLMFE